MSKVTNLDLARAVLARAKRWLQGAQRALEDRRWDDVVYAAQMTVELASKAVLLAAGIDFPKEHDVSAVFRQLSAKDVPAWFREKIEWMTENITELARLRGLAGYGFEVGVDAEYFRDYAPQAYERARGHYALCERLLRRLLRGRSRKSR